MSDFPEPQNYPRDEKMQASPGQRTRGLESIPMFEEAESVTVEIEILKESYDEVLRLIHENEWDLEEGLRTVLLTGLGYQDARLRLEQINNADSGGNDAVTKRVDSLANDLAVYHSMYSVMKFKAFKLYKVNQALEFNVSGLRATEDMWAGWAERMRRQQEELQAEVLRLRSLLSEFKIGWDQPELEALRFVERSAEPESADTPVSAPEQNSLGDNSLALVQAPKRSLWERLRGLFKNS